MRLEVADETFALPAGVTEAWVRLGLVQPVWFVDRGSIVRGVRVDAMRQMVNARRQYHLRRRTGATVD